MKRHTWGSFLLIASLVTPFSLQNQALSCCADDSIHHRFLAFGSVTRIVEADGSVSWTYPAATRDGAMLADGSILLTLSRCEQYPGGAVIEVKPNAPVQGDAAAAKPAETKLIFKGTQSEVNTAQRLDNGNTMLTEAGAHPRILEVDASGAIVVEVAIRGQTDNHHMESRMTRKLANGNYLVPQLLDRVVREYTAKGEVVWEFKTPDEPADAKTGAPKDSWPFTAIRLENGNTLITCTHADMVLEVDAKGAIVWKLSNADFDRPLLHDPCGAQRLDNGNTVICSYAIGDAGTKLLEVTREKQLVWTFVEKDGPGIHEVQILDAPVDAATNAADSSKPASVTRRNAPLR